MLVTLGPHSYTHCPQCSQTVAFFRGPEGVFISEERSYLPDAVVELNCRVHGKFEVLAGELVTEVASR